MRNSSHGSLATVLLLVAVLTVPMLAIFGIPQLMPTEGGAWGETELAEVLMSEPNPLSGTPAATSTAADATAASAPVWASDTNSNAPNLVAGEFANSEAAKNLQAGSANPANSRLDAQQEPLPASGVTSLEQLRFTEPARPGSGPGLSEPTRTAERQAPPTSSRFSALADADFPTRSPGPMPGHLRGASAERPSRAGADGRIVSGGGGAVVNALATEFATEPVKSRISSIDQLAVTDSSPQGYRRQIPLGAGSSGASDTSNDSRVPLTWQAAVKKLNDLEIRNFRLEPGVETGQFVFICSYTPPDQPRVSYRFESDGNEPLRAVEKVLEQIDEWMVTRQTR